MTTHTNQSNCSIKIPHLELIESGLPREIHHFLGYRYVTKEEAYELVDISFQDGSYLFAIQKGLSIYIKENLFTDSSQILNNLKEMIIQNI